MTHALVDSGRDRTERDSGAGKGGRMKGLQGFVEVCTVLCPVFWVLFCVLVVCGSLLPFSPLLDWIECLLVRPITGDSL